MTLKCDELTVHKIFKRYPYLRIPKYQRGYAWKRIQIEEFIADLSECLESKPGDVKFHHFFGGLVAIDTEDNSSKERYLEIIDGQQRLTTFVIFVAQIVHGIVRYINEFKEKIDEEQVKRLSKYADAFKFTYLYHKDEFKITDDGDLKLTPTITDVQFFREMLNGLNQKKSSKNRDSQNNIIEACKLLGEFVRGKIVNYKKPIAVLKNLDKIRDILEEACRFILITTKDHNYAYQYFKVLNNRGTQLTTGNLLKSESLRHLEEKGCQKSATKVANLWDSILVKKPEETERTLQAIFVSRTGKRPSRLKFPEEFMSFVFKIDTLKMNAKFGQRLERITQDVHDDAKTIDLLKEGIWMTDNDNVSDWQQERLRSLVLYLRQKMVMPLLLSFTKKCQSNEFYEAVTILERVICRYINIQKLRPNILENVIRENAYSIYKREYSKPKFRDSLKDFFALEVNDQLFKTSLYEMKYGKGGISENVMKVVFSVLEDHWAWGLNGIGDEPQYEISDSTANLEDLQIRFIHRSSGKVVARNEGLNEKHKNLGNLAIIKSSEETVSASKPFKERKLMYSKSSFNSTRSIGKKSVWKEEELNERQEELVKLALKIFRP